MADIINSLNAANYITVKVTDNPIVNGNNLLSAYIEAKTKTPNGSALSTSNRLGIILPPAIYDLGTQSLTLDTEYIDIIGSTNDKSKHYIKSNITVGSRGVITQTANDVKIINLTVKILGGALINLDQNDPAAYFPNTNLNNTYIENVEFKSVTESLNGFSPVDGFSTRYSIEYSGTYINCKGYYLFFNNIASGTFKDCLGGAELCVPNANGTFINCTGGNNSFGGGPGGIVNGTFINCKGGAGSFEPT